MLVYKQLQSSISMKQNSPFTTDYQHAIIILMRAKLPSFLIGVAVVVFASVMTLKTIGIKVETAKVREPNETKKMNFVDIKTYTVKAGDDLWGIAEKMYGSGYNMEDIAKANKLSEPYDLLENQILIIPSIAPKEQTVGEITEKAAKTEKITEYVVLPGEYLWQIAEKIYGDGNQMSKLIDANRIPYPYNVEEGQKLLVP